MNLKKMTLNINGADRMFICDPAKDTLADVLRRLGLTGTKIGCGMGACGACSVILDGKVIRSCMKKIDKIEEYSSVITVEGIGTVMHPHPLQSMWVAMGAVELTEPGELDTLASRSTPTINKYTLSTEGGALRLDAMLDMLEVRLIEIRKN